jgi:hypothetical protein
MKTLVESQERTSPPFSGVGSPQAEAISSASAVLPPELGPQKSRMKFGEWIIYAMQGVSPA